jgi:hypothetical protein
MSKRRVIAVRLGDLKPNPFRGSLGSIKDEEVDEIYESIDAWGFWGGLAGRTLPDNTVELLVGHRRWEALKRKHGEDRTVEVRILSVETDGEVLRIIGADNSYRHCTPEERILYIRAVKSFLESSSGNGQTSQGDIVRFAGPKNWPKQRVSEILKQIEEEDVKNLPPVVSTVGQGAILATQTVSVPNLPIWASDPRFKPFVDADLEKGYDPCWINDGNKGKYEHLASQAEQAEANQKELEAAREKKRKEELGKTAAQLAELAQGDMGAAVKKLGDTLSSVTSTVSKRCEAVLAFQLRNDLTLEGHKYLRERLQKLQAVVKEQLDYLV